jgi:hypothetical protein
MAKVPATERSLSLGMVTLSVLALVTFILWAIAASMYQGGNGHFGGSGRGMRGRFITLALELAWNGIVSIPEFFSVIGFVFKERFPFVIVVVVIEVVLVLFLLWMRKVDRDLKQGNPFRRNRR